MSTTATWRGKMQLKKINLFYLVLGAFFLSLFLVGIKLVVQKEEWLTVEVKGMAGEWWWQSPAPPAWLANKIEVGDSELDGTGQVIAKVISLEKYPATLREKEVIFKAKLKVSYNKISKKYQFKYQTLKVGTPLTLELPQARVNGIVTRIFDKTPETEEKIVTLKLYSRFPWFAEAIDKDLRFSDGEKVIAKILEKTVELAEMTVVTDQGVVLARRDPLKRDITLKLEMKLQKEAEEYFFGEGELVKIGEKLNLKSEKINLYDSFVVNLE